MQDLFYQHFEGAHWVCKLSFSQCLTQMGFWYFDGLPFCLGQGRFSVRISPSEFWYAEKCQGWHLQGSPFFWATQMVVFPIVIPGSFSGNQTGNQTNEITTLRTDGLTSWLNDSTWLGRLKVSRKPFQLGSCLRCPTIFYESVFFCLQYGCFQK